MKKLEDLKKELLDNKVNKFYVFYGEDFGIRKHYINKISTYFTSNQNILMILIVLKYQVKQSHYLEIQKV